MNSLLFYMSFSGAVVLFMYHLLKALFGNSLSFSHQYLLLKICMCFFLLPIPLLSGIFQDWIHWLFPGSAIVMDPPDVWRSDTWNVIYDTPDGYVHPGFPPAVILLFSVWVLLMLVIFISHIRKYRNLRMLSRELAIAPEEVQNTVERLRKELRIRRKITVFSLNDPTTPFCYGLFKPKIVVSSSFAVEKEEMILQHELQHIKSFDYITQFMGLFILALHFFNPAAYLLFYDINKLREFACDENVLAGRTREQRIHYRELLYDSITVLPAPVATSPFGQSPFDSMKERFTMMKQPRKTKLAVLAACLLTTVFFGSLSVSAYEAPRIEEIVSGDLCTGPSEHMYTFEKSSGYMDPNEEYFRQADVFYIDEYGNVCFDLGESSISAQSLCTHHYTPITLYSHTKNGTGGCTYKVYSAWKCKKCGNITDKTLVSSTTYTKCPH